MSANPSMMKDVHLDANQSVQQVKPAGKSIEYRVMYALIFMVCLAITGLCRLLPRNRHPWICSGDDGSGSLWTEARSAADSTVPYVFQQ
ncbi:MAG: hypothetical protein AB8B64_20755 [Granulosicoccus sp.]